MKKELNMIELKELKERAFFCEKREVRAIEDHLDFYTIRLTLIKDDYKTFLVNRIRLSRC